MSGTTPNEAFIYPLVSDLADPQDWYQIVSKADALVRQYDATFKAAPRPMAFMGRSTSTGPTLTAGQTSYNMDVIEWDTTGGLSGGGWSQPKNDVPSWWVFGVNVFVVLTAGSYTIGDREEAWIQVTTTDPVSGLASASTIRTKREVTGTSEVMTLCGVAQVYNGFVSPALACYGSSTATVGVASGSRFWGWRLGPAST